jgi:Ca-activated chloride channel family protein
MSKAPDVAMIEPSLVPETLHDPRGLGGLIALSEGGERPYPLQSMQVRAAIAGDCCRTTIVQRFGNNLDQPLEAIYIFPLPEDGIVAKMELRAGDRLIRGECREREAAEQAFAEAREKGQRAGLLTEERGDVYTLRVTNLPPKTAVQVELVVEQRLECVDGLFRFRFPTVIPPRYTPGNPIGHAGDGITPDTDRVPEASRLQPPLRLEGGTQLDLQVEIAGPVRRLESSLQAVRVDLGGPDGGVRVAPSGTATLDRDFVLAFSLGDQDQPVTRAWTDGRHTLVVVEPPATDAAEGLPRDAAFVIDISGSMSGVKIDAARRALKTALHGLNEGDRFRLLAFNTGLMAFSEEPRDYNQVSLEAADRWIASLTPSGGTEMLPAVQAALQGDEAPGRARTILLITDGQVTNEQELAAAVSNRRGGARTFTMGIDTAVNAALLKTLARLGGGTCELLTPADDIEAAVARLEARIGAALVDQVVIEGGEPADDRPQALFSGRPVSLLLAGKPDRIRVRGVTPHGEFSAQAEPRPIDFSLGPLWARQRITALEDRLALKPWEEEAVRGEIIRLGLEHQVASRFTAFVAIDQLVNSTGERVEVVQPVELAKDWDRGFAQGILYSAAPSAKLVEFSLATPMETFRDQLEPGVVADMSARSRSTGSRAARRSIPSGPAKDEFITRLVNYVLAGLDPSIDLSQEAEFHHAVDELFEMALADEGVALSKSKRKALFDQVLAEVIRRRAAELGGTLARAQRADGSFGGEASRTAAALLALVLLGNTRRKGLRLRTVQKAARWLKGQEGDAGASLALQGLELAEGGSTPTEILAAIGGLPEELMSAGEEGAILRHAAAII